MYDNKELERKLLLGKNIDLGFCTLHSLKIKEIEDLPEGFDTYNKYLGILCISSDDIIEMLEIDDEDKVIEPFDYIYSCCFYNEGSRKEITDAFKCFIKEEIVFYKEGFFSIGDIREERIVHSGNFNFIIDFMKKQNCISKKQELLKATTAAQKKHLRMLKKMRKKYAKDDGDIYDIISSVCAKHPSVNLLNIGEFTVYQLIDQFKRLNMIQEYSIGIDSLLHGASKDDIKLIHWSSKIDQ